MTQPTSPTFFTRRIGPADPGCGFRCGKPPLDDYFRRYALPNDQDDIGLAYVVEAMPEDVALGLPTVIGYYTLSMASVESSSVGSAIERELPRYPMPVALIGRFAVDQRVQGRGLGEFLLLDALRQVIEGAGLIGCIGAVVDAKDEGAESFYSKYDFITLQTSSWPRRMFLPSDVARTVLADE